MLKGTCREIAAGLKRAVRAKPSKEGFFSATSSEKFHLTWKAFKESPAVTPVSAEDNERIMEELKLAEERNKLSRY